MRSFIIVLSIIGVVVAGATNRNSVAEDTAIIPGLSVGQSKYSKWFELSDKEDAVLIVKVKDTSEAGWADDSIKIIVGYQIADPTLDTTYQSKNEKYARSALIIKDTLTTASLGKQEIAFGVEDSLGNVSEPEGGLDTTNVPGWAVYRANIYPKWGVFIRFFFITITGHSHKVTPCEITLSRRQAIIVRGR